LNPEVPDDLVAVINKALAKDPNNRYQTAAEMASALRNVSGRIKSGAPAEVFGPGATMLEDVTHPSMKLKAITPEPPAPVEGTVVESAPHPSVASTEGINVSGTRSKARGSKFGCELAVGRPGAKPPAADAPRKKSLSMPVIAGAHPAGMSDLGSRSGEPPAQWTRRQQRNNQPPSCLAIRQPSRPLEQVVALAETLAVQRHQQKPQP
jgi:serine/threonine protein kinase